MRTFEIHYFGSTGEAYDASQCADNIHDGDLLVVPAERVIGVLIEAWPTAVTDESGHFHRLGETMTWEELDGGKYLAAAQHAVAINVTGKAWKDQPRVERLSLH